MICILDRPDSPGRIVRMSADGSTWGGLIPNVCSSCGVATYSGPDQERPPAACCGMAVVDSSSMTSWEPSAAAIVRTCAVMARSWLADGPALALPGPTLARGRAGVGLAGAVGSVGPVGRV